MKYSILIFIISFVSLETTIAFSQTPDLLPQQTPNDTLQLVYVSAPDASTFHAEVTCYSRKSPNEPWRPEIKSLPATIGRNGLAEEGMKKEKDGQTPQGEFGVAFVFGVEPSPPKDVKLPYRQATTSDFWIDEETDLRYNRWISGTAPDVSHETLILNDERYNLCLVTTYNENPTILGKGSAIFLHIWKKEDHPTSGCIALSRENVLSILRWLDPSKKPRIRIEVLKKD